MKFYTHKTASIFVIDVKFHKNPLFRLRDVQFFQTAVTNLSYQYNLLPADVICGDTCDRVLIKMLRVEKGYGAERLMAEFPRRNWSLVLTDINCDGNS